MAAEIIATGGYAVPLQADLRSAEAAAALVDAAEEKLGPVDPDELRARIPAGRLGRPEEVADLAAAILGNAYLTNQVISLDGGRYPR